MTIEARERTLTAKQEAFCSFICIGKSQVDAYRAAYDTDNMSQDACYQEASTMMGNPQIALRIKTIKDRASAPAVAVATIQERKSILTTIARSKPETPLTPGQMIAAIKELNLMEKVYEQVSTVNVAIINDAQARLLALMEKRTNALKESAQSTQSLDVDPVNPVIEANS